MSPSKGIVAILILLFGVGVVLAVVFLTRKVEEPSKNFSLSLFTESSCSQFQIRKSDFLLVFHNFLVENTN